MTARKGINPVIRPPVGVAKDPTWQFQPGQSGNPAGRPKGNRNRLADKFLSDLLQDWEDNGPAVLVAMRTDKPAEYVKVVASILPREVKVRVNELDDLTDEQLARQLGAIVARIADAGAGIGEGVGAAEGSEQAVGIPTIQ